MYFTRKHKARPGVSREGGRAVRSGGICRPDLAKLPAGAVKALGAALPAARVRNLQFFREQDQVVGFFKPNYTETFPSMLLQPESEEELKSIFAWARKEKVTLGVKSGGHHPASPWQSGAAVLDLQKLNGIRIDPLDDGAGVAHVQTGARWHEVYAAVSA